MSELTSKPSADADKTQPKPSKGRRPLHLLTPTEALLAINRFIGEFPGLTQVHIAFVLGVSPGQLSKQIGHLSKCALGDTQECKTYNSRTQFMRNIYLLDLANPEVRKGLLRDAIDNAKVTARNSPTIGIDQYQYTGEVCYLLDAGLTLTAGHTFKLKQHREESYE